MKRKNNIVEVLSSVKWDIHLDDITYTDVKNKKIKTNRETIIKLKHTPNILTVKKKNPAELLFSVIGVRCGAVI